VHAPKTRHPKRQIENQLAKEILEGKFVAKDTIKVDYSDDKLNFTKLNG